MARSGLIRGLIGLQILVAFVLIANPASAQAQLDFATPADKAIVKVSPKEVQLTFSGRIEAALSSIGVRDELGNSVDTSKPYDVDLKPTTIAVTVRNGLVGKLTVTYRVTAADGNELVGSTSFSVAPALPAEPVTAAVGGTAGTVMPPTIGGDSDVVPLESDGTIEPDVVEGEESALPDGPALSTDSDRKTSYAPLMLILFVTGLVMLVFRLWRSS